MIRVLIIRHLDGEAVAKIVGDGQRLVGIAEVSGGGSGVGAPAVGAQAGVLVEQLVGLVAHARHAAVRQDVGPVVVARADGLAAVPARVGFRRRDSVVVLLGGDGGWGCCEEDDGEGEGEGGEEGGGL